MIGPEDALVLDACVLYPASLRDLLIRLSAAGFYRARWSERILNEMIDHLEVNESHPRIRLERTRSLMNQAINESVIQDYESLTETLVLPDPDDRHVLAAAIHAGASAIVTFNTKDFPESMLLLYGIHLLKPDELVAEFIWVYPDETLEVIQKQRGDLKRPPYTAQQLADRFHEIGLKQTAIFLRDHLSAF